jgi:hypothetical protein
LGKEKWRKLLTYCRSDAIFSKTEANISSNRTRRKNVQPIDSSNVFDTIGDAKSSEARQGHFRAAIRRALQMQSGSAVHSSQQETSQADTRTSKWACCQRQACPSRPGAIKIFAAAKTADS